MTGKKGEKTQTKDPFEEMLMQLRNLDDELESLWRNPTKTEQLEVKLSESKRIRAELLHIAELKPDLLRRLREETYKAEPVQTLLGVFLSKGVPGLNPTVEEGSIVYESAEEAVDVSPRYVLELLKHLSEFDILLKKFEDKILSCPKCSYYSETITHYKCPKCASRDIETIKLLEHLACGTVHEKSRYQKRDKLTCPKCGVDVNIDGLRAVGVTFKCNSCEETFSDPLELVYCKNCKGEFSMKEAEFFNAYNYTLNPKLKEEIIKALYISTLSVTLSENGFEVETPSILKGRAQLALSFTIVAKKDKTILAVELLHAENGVSLSDILPSVAKFDDVEYIKPVLVAVPSLIGEAGEFLNSRGVSYITGKELEDMKLQMNALLKTLSTK